jgi:hypothetical protein
MIGVFAIIRSFGLHVDQVSGRTLTRERRVFQNSSLANAYADRY